MPYWKRPESIRIATEANLDPEVRSEIEEFNRERERVRVALRNIGGRDKGALDKVANAFFVAGLSILLILHFGLDLIGDILSLELGLLFVSVKILWMMRSQERYQHFLFWMLHSIEYRQNEILQRLEPRQPAGPKREEGCPEPGPAVEPKPSAESRA